MTRQIDAATIAALASDNLNMVTLLQIDFDTPIKVTNWARNVSALSTTFLSSSDLLEIDQVSESSELQINSLNLTFSGVSQTFVALFLTNDYIDVRTRIWTAVLDNSDAVIGEPILLFDGRITGYGISDTQDSSNVQVEVASHWKDFDKINGRKTNSNTQQLYFAGDKGFDFAAESAKDIKWGKI
jgi:hypothetical protein